MANVNPNTLITNFTNGSRRYITVQGPIKIEYVFLQPNGADDFADGNTDLISRLAHPLFASVVPISDIASTALVASVAVDNDQSSATFKTVTIHDHDTLTGVGILIAIHGW